MPAGSQDWLEDIADEYPDEAWVQQAAYPEGRFDYEAELWHGLYWDAWNTLRYDRPYGAMGGQGAIPYMVISRYAEDHGIVGDDFWLFRTLMDVLDSVWLMHVAERDKARNRGEDREQGRRAH